MNPTASSYSIGSLAAAAGVSRRTVRFYVQRGLLPPPEGLGRGAHYTGDHLACLLQIKGWQEQGVPLDEIRARLRGDSTPPGDRRFAPPPGRTPGAEPNRAARAAQGRQRGSLGVGPDDLVSEAPGTSWFRQPLVFGFELHVAGSHRPLGARQLATLASALSQILENGADEK